MPFDGKTYDSTQDRGRLTAQLDDVRKLMLDGAWHTLEQIANAVSAPQASVSARLRDLRKDKFGGYTVERERVPGGNGLHRYRLIAPAPQPKPLLAQKDVEVLPAGDAGEKIDLGDGD